MALLGFFKKKRSKKRVLSETLLSLLVITGIAGFIIVRSTQGATYTWDGEGTDITCPGNEYGWSCADNWSSNTVPTASDIAQFNNTSDKNATVDASFAGSVAGVTVASGYDGTITQAAALQVGSSHFSQAAGTWDTDGFAITVVSDGNFTVSAGSMDATGSTISTERNFTHSGGSLISSGATLNFTSSGFTDSSIMTCSGIFSGTVDIQKDDESSSTAGSFTLSSGCTITLVASVITKGAITNNGIMYATNINTQDNFTQAANATTIMSGTLTFDDDSYLDSAIMTCTGTFQGIVDIEKNDTASGISPSFTLSSGCIVNLDTTINAYGDLINNGTMNGTSLNVQQDFTQGANGVTNLSGTLNLTSDSYLDSATVTCTGVLRPIVDLSKDGEASGITNELTISSGCSVTLVASEFMNGDITNHGTLNITDLDIERDLFSDGTLNVTGTLTFSSDTYQDSATLTCDDVIQQFVLAKDESFSSVGADFTLSSGCRVNLLGDGMVAGALINNGTLQGGNLQVNRYFTNAGTLELSGTLTFAGGSIFDNTNMVCTAPFSVPAVVLNKTNSNTLTLAGNCTIAGNFTRTNGGLSNPGSAYTLTIHGNLTIDATDTFGGGNLTIQFSGANNQTITQNASSFSSPIVINKPAGRVTQATAVTVNATGLNFTITDGEYSNASFSLSVNNTLTVGGGELYQGTGNISAAGYTINDGGTWINSSTGDITVGASGVTNNGVVAFGNPASCGGTDNIAITSSSGGVQRSWSGTGGFQMYDVSVTDQGGSSAITAFSSTEGTGVGTNWDIQANCPITAPRLGNNSRLKGGVRLD